MPETTGPDGAGATGTAEGGGAPPRPAARRPPPRVLRSDELLAGGAEVLILHGGDAYRLRLTSKDKLILTK